MKLTRLITATLLVVVLVGSIAFTALAEGNAYGRWGNPGQGHDWSEGKGNNNQNKTDLPCSENGYLNHLPADGPEPTPPPARQFSAPRG